MIPRRVKTVFLLALMFLIMMLIYSSHVRETQPRDTRTLQDFYKKTKNALDNKDGSAAAGAAQAVVDSASGKTKGRIPVDKDADGDVDDDDAKLAKEMAGRLKAAEQQAKDLANAKSPNKPDPPSNVVGVGSAAGGQNKGGVGETADEGADEITVELNTILKKSPVIIFSKSYCPYSKKAKGVLLEKYYIDPTPYVVELDEHPHGAQLQAKLGDLTGRKTVPNVMVAGKSIGGGDDIAELDNRKTLIDKVKSLAGKRVTMKERFVEDSTAERNDAGSGGAGL